MNKLDKADIYILLDKMNIWYRSVEHKAVYTMSEAAETASPFPEAGAKNLFIRDDKKQNYYLITVKGDKRVDLKVFRRKYKSIMFCVRNRFGEHHGSYSRCSNPVRFAE